MPFQLPDAPAQLTDSVKAWFAPVIIPTYLSMAPEKNPMFFEKRIYQGSSGAVYPMPVIDRIAIEPVQNSWHAAHIENEFIRLMVLPQIGGRIHVGLDKTNGYDFFYRQNVIKPALVGLAGPWISGGVEFNWPQHHRPGTFTPVNTRIEAHEDGSRTIWCSDHDPLNRLKGMHGICLHPSKSYVELKVRVHNRTPFVQTFLWWANVGVQVHELYQSFLPPDVRYVADHAKRAVSTFPLCSDRYCGVNYAERAKQGVPEGERPRHYVPPGTYASNDLSWYANIPVPTSYMAIHSVEDSFGGYDHKHRAGLIHVADHHISPGKKQWTWGNHEFGYAWDRNLTDEDGPYIELMAGVFTDNQPDFSFLAPGETRTFSQYWYPYREIGPVQKASREIAISFAISNGTVRVGVCATQEFRGAVVRVYAQTKEVAKWIENLSPVSPLIRTTPQAAVSETDFLIVVERSDGKELLRYAPSPAAVCQVASPATEPLLPSEMLSNDELYITGLHLDQYRHATRDPHGYWQEALRRDPEDSRCNNAIGLWHLRRGEFQQAERHFRNAIARLTKRNPNPRDGEPYYNLGLALRYLGRDQSAYDAFSKATWNHAWQSPAHFALAELDVKRGEWQIANRHLRDSLRTNADHSSARNLAVIVLRKLGMRVEGERLLYQTLDVDALDSWATYLADGALPDKNQMLLDLAFDYSHAGLYAQALEILHAATDDAKDGSVPMVFYAIGYFNQLVGDHESARANYLRASSLCRDYCFPKRLEELAVLEAALAANPEDGAAAYYLGNLLYDRRRHREAISRWEQAASLSPFFSVVWRNLGIAYFNVLGDCDAARSAYDEALQANSSDARVLYERDQLWKRLGESTQTRLTELEKYPHLVRVRDDLSIELAALYNQNRQHDKALNLITSRKFQPWEGGEGLVLAQYVRAHLALGRSALAENKSREALALFEAALTSPANLGEAKHLLANQSDVYYWLGVAEDAIGGPAAGKYWWEHAAGQQGDFQRMKVESYSEMTYYSALALKRLHRSAEAESLLRSLLGYAEELAKQPAKIEYFATSLPDMLLFDEDLQKRQLIAATFLQAQAWLGLGDATKARLLLKTVLELDRNHALAADLLAETETQSDCSGEPVGAKRTSLLNSGGSREQ
jgi:tetratricopeptide (TPR) repeat protein